MSDSANKPESPLPWKEQKYFDLHVEDFSTMSWDDAGRLTIDVPMMSKGVTMRLRFSYEATRKAWVLLSRLQQFLETNAGGAPPSDAQH